MIRCSFGVFLILLLLYKYFFSTFLKCLPVLKIRSIVSSRIGIILLVRWLVLHTGYAISRMILLVVHYAGRSVSRILVTCPHPVPRRFMGMSLRHPVSRILQTCRASISRIRLSATGWWLMCTSGGGHSSGNGSTSSIAIVFVAW